MVISPIGNLKAAVVVGSGGTGVLADARRLTLRSPRAHEFSPVHRNKSHIGPRAPPKTEIPPSYIASAARAV